MTDCVCCRQGHKDVRAVEGDRWCQQCQKDGCHQPAFTSTAAISVEMERDRLRADLKGALATVEAEHMRAEAQLKRADVAELQIRELREALRVADSWVHVYGGTDCIPDSPCDLHKAVREALAKCADKYGCEHDWKSEIRPFDLEVRDTCVKCGEVRIS